MIWSYVQSRFEDGNWSGVPRFDSLIRKVFPEMRSVTRPPKAVAPTDVVITDNHLCLNLRPETRKVVVHHGSAAAHYERDLPWRNSTTERMVKLQSDMLSSKNVTWVAPSDWVRREFAARHKLPESYATVIPHWVKLFGPAKRRSGRRPIVIGDWRDSNKGSLIIESLRREAPDIEFRQMRFSQEGREAFYLDADLFLCLSLSEGASYAAADAEACELPIVMTDVGLSSHWPDTELISWASAGNPRVILGAIRKKLAEGRRYESFYKTYSFEVWASQWRKVVGLGGVAMQAAPPAILPARQPELATPTEAITPRISGTDVVLGLSAGIGNAVFALPLLKALRDMGKRVSLYLQGDYPMKGLFSRCAYVEDVFESPDPVPPGDVLLCGPWRPKNMMSSRVHVRTWKREGVYLEPEWSILLSHARDMGWNGRKPDVSGWCRDVAQVGAWDVGIIQGAKPDDHWKRKRYPGMAEVADRLVRDGLRVAVFGTEEDRGEEAIPGEDLIGKFQLQEMPDALSSCRAVVGTDSGMTHLASSLGIPTVVIYTATSEMKGDPVGLRSVKVYRDLPCAPCQSTYRWGQCSSWVCRDIPPAQLVAMARGALTSRVEESR